MNTKKTALLTLLTTLMIVMPTYSADCACPQPKTAILYRYVGTLRDGTVVPPLCPYIKVPPSAQKDDLIDGRYTTQQEAENNALQAHKYVVPMTEEYVGNGYFINNPKKNFDLDLFKQSIIPLYLYLAREKYHQEMIARVKQINATNPENHPKDQLEVAQRRSSAIPYIAQPHEKFTQSFQQNHPDTYARYHERYKNERNTLPMDKPVYIPVIITPELKQKFGLE